MDKCKHTGLKVIQYVSMYQTSADDLLYCAHSKQPYW